MGWFSRKPPSDEQGPLKERVRALEHEVEVLKRDMADLSDRYRRRAARMRKHDDDTEDAAPANGAAAGARTLPTVAQLRASGRYPFTG